MFVDELFFFLGLILSFFNKPWINKQNKNNYNPDEYPGLPLDFKNLDENQVQDFCEFCE